MELEVLFCEIDDFCKDFEKQFNRKLINNHQRQRAKKSRLFLSKIMTIIIYFHSSSYRNFKAYYQEKMIKYH